MSTIPSSTTCFRRFLLFSINLFALKDVEVFLMKLTWLAILSVLFSCSADVTAAVRLPKIFSSHMVLQRQMPIRVFGWADADEVVTVDFNGYTATKMAGQDGGWEVELPAMEADGQSHTLTVGSSRNGTSNSSSAASTGNIVLNDVVLGEVWLCSGQSNMEWSLNN
ncbi:MAG: hypothetical protein N2C12_00275, partial [Planctomycetales bacterium]